MPFAENLVSHRVTESLKKSEFCSVQFRCSDLCQYVQYFQYPNISIFLTNSLLLLKFSSISSIFVSQYFNWSISLSPALASTPVLPVFPVSQYFNCSIFSPTLSSSWSTGRPSESPHLEPSQRQCLDLFGQCEWKLNLLIVTNFTNSNSQRQWLDLRNVNENWIE